MSLTIGTTRVAAIGTIAQDARVSIGYSPIRVAAIGVGTQGIAGSSASVIYEPLAGVIDGSNKVFTMSHIPTAFVVFKNGVAQHVGGGNDFTISGLTVTYNTAPLSGDVLMVFYIF